MPLIVAYTVALVYLPLVYLAYRLLKRSPSTGAIVSVLVALVAALSLVFGIGLATIVSYPVLAYLLSSKLRGRLPLPLLASFILVGVATTLPVIAYWPQESAIHFNPLSVIAGDELYSRAVLHLGDPHSPYADHTVPPILRPPTVYLVSSLIVWGFIGVVGEVLYRVVRGTGT